VEIAKRAKMAKKNCLYFFFSFFVDYLWLLDDCGQQEAWNMIAAVSRSRNRFPTTAAERQSSRTLSKKARRTNQQTES
ncbi:MAG: hypothetical protein ACK2U5_22140, partial [Candidatus Promineifilaceae bacterium]